MKLALAEGFYTTRQLAAAAQDCINFYPETVETPGGSGKGTRILRKIPGYTAFVNLNAHSGTGRGVWSCDSPVSGIGRLFAVVGQWFYEVNSVASTVASYDLGSNDGLPVQMFGNGNQLGLVANGQFYINNGAGPIKARFQLNGTVAIAGTAVTWVSGDKFPVYIASTADPLPTAAFINGAAVAITFTSATTATLGTAIAGGTGTVTRNNSVVFWSSGTTFDSSWVGMTIVISGVSYTINSVYSAYALTISETPAGIEYGAAYTVTVGNNTYSTAGGALVTAVTGAYMDGTFYVQRPASASYSTAYTDLVIDGTYNNLVTSAAHPFTQDNVGEVITITAGTGFTVGEYTVINVSSARATLSAAVGTVGSTGGTGVGVGVDLGRQVNFSAVFDGTSWSGLDFFSKDSYPDYISCIIADRGQIHVFGTNSYEPWQNDLTTGRPVRVNGGVAPEGSYNRYAVVSMAGHIYFIGGPPGGNAIAYRMDGYTPTRISTHAIEEAWATDTNAFITGASGWWYEEDGHYFWVLQQINGAPAWVYDATERAWHKRLGWNGTNTGSYLLANHTFVNAWGYHICGFAGTSTLYRQSSGLYDAAGGDIRCQRVLPYIYAGGGKRVYVNRVDLDMATGLIPSGTEPTITLEWSADNGQTWSTPEAVGFGLHNETAKRVFWLAQGSSETSLIPRLTVTGQTVVMLVDCEAEVEYGDS